MILIRHSLQWRLPLALGCLSPLITLVGAYWLPESPRYLVWVDEKDEAWRVLRILHYDVDDPQEEAAQAELQQITLQVAFDKTQKAGYIAIFRKPSWRKRALITIFLLFATQCTGILAIGNLQVLLYNSLGLTGWLPLLFYAMYTLIGTIPNFLCSIFMENIGRRKLLRKSMALGQQECANRNSHGISSRDRLPYLRNGTPEVLRRNHKQSWKRRYRCHTLALCCLVRLLP